MIEYLMESSAWSVGGLCLGYFLGRTERQVRLLVRKDRDREIREAEERGRRDNS